LEQQHHRFPFGRLIKCPSFRFRFQRLGFPLPAAAPLLSTNSRQAQAFPPGQSLSALQAEAKAAVATAEKLINTCGYHRRDEELADAKQVLLGS
jgi:hypothetical protein